MFQEWRSFICTYFADMPYGELDWKSSKKKRDAVKKELRNQGLAKKYCERIYQRMAVHDAMRLRNLISFIMQRPYLH